jgi:bacterioferritin
MDFERALSREIPLAEAATFFLKLKTAAPDGPAPPDETGQLEGEFAAPVEQVLQLMGEMVENELKTMYAYKAYAASLRDLSHHAIAKEFEEHADNELEHTEFLLRRMAVLGGPINLPAIPAPPATTDPNEVVALMVRMEQEGIERWRKLLAMLGENPTRYKVEEYLTRELEHLDELWQLRPYQAGAAPAPPEAPAPLAQPAPAPAAPAAPPAPAAPADGPKLANAAMADMPQLPPTGKGQNPVQAAPIQLPATAMGQHQKAAAAFKLALEETGIAPPADPMQAYVAREQEAAAAQEGNELEFYRARMQQAFAELQQQKQQSEQTAAQMQQLQSQIEQTQAQQTQYQQMVSNATQQAVSATDDVLREQQASAAMRMAYQQLRGELLNVASREPPNTQMLQEQAALTSAPAPTMGPAGQAADPGTPPGSVSPTGDQTASQPAAGTDGQMQQAKPATEVGQKETGAAPQTGEQKTASALGRLPHALAGAALGGVAETAYAHKSSDPLRAKVDRLESQPERGFGAAMDLAQAKARLALADAVDNHPKAALLSGMALGGLEGAISGPRFVDHMRQGVENLGALAG